MILFMWLMVFAFIFPSAAAIIMRIVSFSLLIPLMFFGSGCIAFFLAVLFGDPHWDMSTYLTYCLIWGTIPGLMTAKMTLID